MFGQGAAEFAAGSGSSSSFFSRLRRRRQQVLRDKSVRVSQRNYGDGYSSSRDIALEAVREYRERNLSGSNTHHAHDSSENDSSHHRQQHAQPTSASPFSSETSSARQTALDAVQQYILKTRGPSPPPQRPEAQLWPPPRPSAVADEPARSHKGTCCRHFRHYSKDGDACEHERHQHYPTNDDGSSTRRHQHPAGNGHQPRSSNRGSSCRFRHESIAAADAPSAEAFSAQESSDAEEGTCIVCMEAEATHVLVPCGHLCLCAEHAQTIVTRGDGCPICRTAVRSHLRVYKAGRA